MYDEPIYPSSRHVFVAGVCSALALGVMGTLRWLGIPAGELVDWLVAIAGFWWLLAITIVPWNLYFGARQVQGEIVLSKKRGILVERDDAKFVQRTARRSLSAAIVLHLGSTVAFAAVAVSGLTTVGWFAAVAALALTLLRPAVRLYRHIAQALRAVGQRVKYPRDDVRTSLERLEEHSLRIDVIETDLQRDLEDSWAYRVEGQLAAVRKEIVVVRQRLDALIEGNEQAHRKLARDAERAAQRLGEDSAFLGNVREIIRFVKDA